MLDWLGLGPLWSSIPPDELLARRLAEHGLRGVRRVRTHRNRSVMLSLTSRGELRLHEGYAYAPDRVIAAIARFLDRHQPRAARKAAEREFLAFAVERHAPPPRRAAERPEPGDVAVYHRLEQLHQRLNDRHFGGALRPVPFRLSGRMRTRLGELSLDLRSGEVQEIAISRRHLRRHGWAEVERTLLHEMVHQWQAEHRLPVDHGPGFRRKALEVGVEPRARRDLGAHRASRAG